ncbi:apolipoprotein N-acyltransferase [Jannaschia sp. W003]|uniref:apolipoprotein N-acyltransferase n=1 Tax=Jannaschia sp. W003 TaxID=2867012 RepID=UPI0021A4ED0B|nr:apolipoprotein N-acyltransferase [Jannaschia sp. W003]UWQ22937.1 apolipoprotein N-acyltransferase [Jannaschia sp. W003]
MTRRWTEAQRRTAAAAAPPPHGTYGEGPDPIAWDVREQAARHPLRDRAAGAVLLAVAGAMAALGQAPWNLWWLALPAWALVVAVAARGRVPFLAVWLMVSVELTVALHWIVEPFLVVPSELTPLAPLTVVITAVGLAFFPALGAGLGALLAGRGTAARALGIGAGIMLGEMARSWLFTGFPWALPGHALIGSAALPAAAFAGAQGLGIAVVLGGALVAAFRPVALAAGLALWALPFVLAATLPPAPPPAADAPVVRLVQPNAPQAQKWDPAFVNLFWRRSLELTAGPGRADAVVWPETALPMLLERAGGLRPAIARAAGGAPAVVGAQRYGPEGDPRNALILLTGLRGEVDLVYDKHHLVPFGEYLPLPRLFAAFGFGPLAANLAGGYGAGEGPVVFDLPGVGRAMPMICYEAIFPQYLRRVARPELLLQITNDAWFGPDAGPRQHLALARMRAAESGLPLLRAANTGISAAIDARGTVMSSLALNEAGALDAALPPALPPTPYARTGDLAPLLVLLALLAGLAALRFRHTP